MDLTLTPEQEAVRDTAREIADKRILPRAAEYDASETFPVDAVRELAELGLLGMMIPPSHGGAGMDAISYALALIELGRADASIAVTLSVNNLVAECVTQWGSDDQKNKFLPKLATAEGLGAFAVTEAHAGSDVQAIRTTATRNGDHYI